MLKQIINFCACKCYFILQLYFTSLSKSGLFQFVFCMIFIVYQNMAKDFTANVLFNSKNVTIFLVTIQDILPSIEDFILLKKNWFMDL